MTQFNRVVIGIGSNTSNKIKNVEEALHWLTHYLNDITYSTIYTTEAYKKDGNDYANCIAQGYTTLDSNELSQLLKKYEVTHGRDSEARKQKIVPIDLDILIYSDTIIRAEELKRTYIQIGLTQLEIKNKNLNLNK